ncbi:TetR/AcrR family transcriptional regulator [Mammaliicoccus vitulinus]|uniref:TetR/AcrR family transcriptional regulator n=1 Tax=Mammaliicoccus vitulinus TaxID=71237 RepID=A0ABX7HG39_9STAP|nr:TetR/AcrR family transcriptional regulator [Mammaliicoccus vitulinus]MBO3078028.1 TetR/AcrR family transcriptional regulator [Mammaliicoccus vitulinus]MEB7657859.1 TetR/AcrR family transcriptional regulator [Mammaliicoccus vitulinus]PNZ37563.1 TetR family transcriptional regulator [Mammaliicoccus vitulinus]PTI37046.1 TetR/AcrR family transcriptional regulator [Mammaliicoccus vitulinus]PTI90053.1 TetR/AcrR family transcriptional regulator [Mammaliicoccus vitulinus]
MNKHTDLRVIKTKKALNETLIKLLTIKNFSDITVNEICEKSLIHRTTFYKHFMDKFDLLQYTLSENTKGFFKLDLYDRLHKPFQSMEKAFIDKLNDVFDKQMDNNDTAFIDELIKHFIEVFSKDFKDNIDKVSTPTHLPQSLLPYIYGTNLAAIIHWSDSVQGGLDFEKLDEIFNEINIISLNETK